MCGTNGCLAGGAYVIIILEILEDVRVLSRGVVAALTIRVEVLEEKYCMTSIINLEPRNAFPGNPCEGDLCVVGQSGHHHIYCYLNGGWVQLDQPVNNNVPPNE